MIYGIGELFCLIPIPPLLETARRGSSFDWTITTYLTYGPL